MKTRVFVVCCFIVALAAVPALASGGVPAFKAVAKLSQPSGGQCDSASKATWRNAQADVNQVEFTFFVNGTQTSSQTVQLTPGSTRGSVSSTVSPPVPASQTFSFTATFRHDTSGLGQATSNTLTC